MRGFLLLAVVVCLPVQAQELDGGAQPAVEAAPPPAPAPATIAAPAPAAAVPPAPAPAATPAPAPAIPLPAVRIHGIIKPTVAWSSAAVESYSQPNATAITAAANPVFANSPSNPRLTFQAGQSRFGIWVGENWPVRAHVEFDFVDFTKASPTVASLPRVRLAYVDWKPVPDLFVLAGQDWDLVQPINPHGVNLVGGLFQAGNTAFMRQQVKAQYTIGSTFEVGVAVGLQNNNNLAKDALVELSNTPTFAVRGQLNLGKAGRIGVSGIATSLLFRVGTENLRTFAGLAGVFGEVTAGPLNLRFEGYLSQNSANLFLLTLGQGRAGLVNGAATVTNLAEAGGFASARLAAGEVVGIYAMVGGAAVLNPDALVPSYSYPGTSTEPSASALAGTGPGMRTNLGARLGFDVKIYKGVTFQLEGFIHTSNHVLQQVDLDRGTATVATALGAETAFIYSF